MDDSVAKLASFVKAQRLKEETEWNRDRQLEADEDARLADERRTHHEKIDLLDLIDHMRATSAAQTPRTLEDLTPE